MSIDDEDRDLFRSSVGSVRRISAQRVQGHHPRPAPRPRQRERDEAAVMDELAHGPIDFEAIETGEELTWLRPGLQRRVLTRLRRGHWRVQDEIDLHQMNTEAAAGSIRAFITAAHRDGLSCVKIIHGKGLRSGPDGPRLKRLTARLLTRIERVCAFASAPRHDGGTGAVYVLLKTRP
ncbi:MAG: SMR domain protein [Wenzhouxiangella sp.]|nr:MAG: SMR domain protein [Wenzhouxiangella sp.]